MELKYHLLENYIYKEYEWIDPKTKSIVVYRIDNPIGLFTVDNGETHRVVDVYGIVHVVPSVGIFGCRIKYKKEEDFPKATF